MFPLNKKYTVICLILIGILYIIARPRKKASELIQDVLDFSEYLDETTVQMKGFLTDNKYDSLVTDHVKPAIDQIASIRKQTEIYEGMQRIPGGPQNFMTTSLAALEKLQNELHEWESQYRIATARLGKVWTMLSGRIESCTKRLDYFDSDAFDEPLAALQIYFRPTDFEDPERQNKKPPEKISLGRIMTIVTSKLLPLVQRLEQLKISNNLSPHFQTNDLQDLRLTGILKDLMVHLTTYSSYYETVGVHWMKGLNNLKKMTLGIDKMDVSKTRYEELAVGIDLDITSLQERIRMLKSPKKQSDEF